MKKINISPISTFFVNNSYAIEFLFYFPYRINIIRLRHALKKVSTHFWPAFGTYANGCIIEKAYHEKECFDESFVDEVFNPNMQGEPLHIKFKNMIPESIQRLFFLKVLHFSNGTVLIPKMNHLVGDGYSYFFLLLVLATITRQGRIPLAPSIITTFYKPKIQSSFHTPFHFSASPPDVLTFDSKLVVEILEVEQTETHNQAKLASESSGLRISANDILSATVVKIILDNRKKKPLENFQLVIPIDIRRGVKEIGQRFFGNGFILHRIPFQSDVVSNSSIEQLAIKIRKSLPDVTRENYETFLKKVEGWIEAKQFDLLRPYNPTDECLVTNLSRMPITKLDFGLGPPTMVIPLTTGRSGAAVLAQNNKFILYLVR